MRTKEVPDFLDPRPPLKPGWTRTMVSMSLQIGAEWRDFIVPMAILWPENYRDKDGRLPNVALLQKEMDERRRNVE